MINFSFKFITTPWISMLLNFPMAFKLVVVSSFCFHTLYWCLWRVVPRVRTMICLTETQIWEAVVLLYSWIIKCQSSIIIVFLEVNLGRKYSLLIRSSRIIFYKVFWLLIRGVHTSFNLAVLSVDNKNTNKTNITYGWLAGRRLLRKDTS